MNCLMHSISLSIYCLIEMKMLYWKPNVRSMWSWGGRLKLVPAFMQLLWSLTSTGKRYLSLTLVSLSLASHQFWWSVLEIFLYLLLLLNTLIILCLICFACKDIASCMKQCQLHNKHSVTISVICKIGWVQTIVSLVFDFLSPKPPVKWMLYAVFTKLFFERSNTYVSVLPVNILMHFPS